MPELPDFTDEKRITYGSHIRGWTEVNIPTGVTTSLQHKWGNGIILQLVVGNSAVTDVKEAIIQLYIDGSLVFNDNYEDMYAHGFILPIVKENGLLCYNTVNHSYKMVIGQQHQFRTEFQVFVYQDTGVTRRFFCESIYTAF